MVVDFPIEQAESEPRIPSPEEFQAAIDDVLADETMSDAEKTLRLETLRQEFIVPEHVEHDPYGTIQTRLGDALAMLAEGGHLYRPIPPEDDKI
jgi:hypothetical protein